MAWFARMVYRALVWKEKQRAKSGRETVDEQATDRRQVTGERGETLVYWHLRQAGYVMVARNWRLDQHSGELDMVGWDGPVLAFVEVKTRSSDVAGGADEALTRAQRTRLVRTARRYVQRHSRGPVEFRFDVASVGWNPSAGFEVQVIKDAFRD